MTDYVMDIETNGLLDQLDRVHCMVIKNRETGEVFQYTPDTVEQGVRLLDSLTPDDRVCGHNVIAFDFPALQKVYSWFEPKFTAVDTLVLTRVLWPQISDFDADPKENRFSKPEPKRKGSHSLEAWGQRIGTFKMDYSGGWDEFTTEMLEYNVVDVEVTDRLWTVIQSEQLDERASEIEHRVADICARQERYGFPFDEKSASKLACDLLVDLHKTERELQDTFTPWVVADGEVRQPPYPSEEKGWWGEYLEEEVQKIEKGEPVFYKKTGLPKMVTKKTFEGYPFQNISIVTFNPSSRHHIANRLTTKYGWRPTEFTPDGSAKVDETVLSKLPYPEAKLLTHYLLLQKRLGLLQGKDRDKGWLNVVKSGRVHGSIVTNGAVTGRGTHRVIANIPRVETTYGKELRALFTASKGRVMVGVDMSGIEFRCLAHYIGKYDDGAWGRKVAESDIHTVNQKAAGLETRSQAKTFLYATLYGGGPAKIGSIVRPNASLSAQREAGVKLKKKFIDNTPGFGNVLAQVEGVATKYGYIPGLDGRKLHVRKAHAALNVLLQSTASILSKKWMMEVDDMIKQRGWSGKVQQLIWYHDEIQFDVDPDIAEEFASECVRCITTAGEYFNIRVPLAGEAKIGKNWAECH